MEIVECNPLDSVNFNDVVYNASAGYAVGDNGFIAKIPNDSCILEPIQSFTTKDLNGISSLGQNNNVIVGDGGYVFVDFDEIVSLGTTVNFNDILSHTEFTLEKYYITVGDSGKIFKSTDFGQSWYNIPSGTTQSLKIITRVWEEHKFRVVGSNGVYLHSSDMGETWTLGNVLSETSSAGLPDFYAIDFISDKTGWAAGQFGVIFKTTNGGLNWRQQNSGLFQTINCIRFNTFSYGYAISDGGRVLETTTGGALWSPHPVLDTVTTADLKKLIQKDSVQYTMVGDSGKIINVISDFENKPLEGIYTIGSTGDFENFELAVRAADFLGIGSDVTFEIQPGVYREKIILNDILGTDSATLTFRSSTNNPGDVILIDSSASSATNYTLRLNAVKNINFENITFEAKGVNYGTAVLFSGNINNANFNNVNFIGSDTQSASVDLSTLSSDGSIATNLSDLNFQNCTFSNGSTAMRFHSTGASNYFSNISVSNCSFENCGYGINFSYVQNFDIIQNNFENVNYGIGVGNSRNLEVQKNKISAGTSGIELAISSTTGSNRNLIANNFIRSGFYGIRLTSSNLNNDIYYNSINIENPLDTTSQAASSSFATFAFSGSNNNVINNLFINSKSGLAFSFGGSGLSSLNYNNYFTNGINLANWQSAFYTELNTFRAASNRDTNSVSREIFFISPTDLHLDFNSNGDEMLKAKPVSIVTDDIDLELRHSVYPYMGADEASILLPVELQSFSHSIDNRNVILYWTTSSEENNSGFEVERSNVNSQSSNDFTGLAFIRGNGNSNSVNNYSYEDRNLNSGEYKYRLKQIDFNGNFKYYNLNTEVEIGIPQKFELSQNYPNPFNPKTIINYQLPVSSQVELKVYDISGKEILTLVNEKQSNGYYTVELNSGSLSSGIYIYRIIAGEYVQSKKMVVIK